MDTSRSRPSISASVLWTIKESSQGTLAQNAFDPARIVILLVGPRPAGIASFRESAGSPSNVIVSTMKF
jgi:hypothetical protein